MLRHSLAAMQADCRSDCLCVSLVHRRDFDAVEGGKENGAASVPCRKLCCFGLLVECGKLGSEGFSACFDGRQIDRLG